VPGVIPLAQHGAPAQQDRNADPGDGALWPSGRGPGEQLRTLPTTSASHPERFVKGLLIPIPQPELVVNRGLQMWGAVRHIFLGEVENGGIQILGSVVRYL
jgi:hypothetical protein